MLIGIYYNDGAREDDLGVKIVLTGLYYKYDWYSFSSDHQDYSHFIEALAERKRRFDLKMPEEINRIVMGSISNSFFVTEDSDY